MGGRIGLALALILGLLGALWASQPPAPLAADAPATFFSAGRAMADVRAIGQHPHPAGSADHARVRAWLAARMQAAGLEVRAQPGISLRVKEEDGEVRAEGADVVNLIGVLPGRDRAAPAVGVMAHYDSVPGSPGAADDGAGVAAALEIVRALRATGSPARDVVLIMTDAEEAGLHGARAFFAADPLRDHIGFLVNMDVRGDAGRAVMHETGPNAGETIALYARVVRDPTTDSVAREVKRFIRNNTDFALAADRGLQGVNLSFLGNQFDYHAASSTPAALDPGSLQHLGAQGLAVTRAVAQASALPAPAPDKVYASLLGLVTIAYPPWVGWLLLGAAALIAVFAWTRGDRPSAGQVARGLGVALLLCLAAAAAIHLLRVGTGAAYGFTVVRPLLARWAWFEAAVGAMSLAVILATFVRVRRSTIDEALPFGLFALLLIAGVAAQALVPGAAVNPSWVLLASSIMLLAAALLRGRLLPLLGLLAVPVLIQILCTAHLILLTIGENAPEIAALYAAMVALVLAPLLVAASREGGMGRCAALAASLAVLLVIAIRLIDPATVARPRTSQVVYVADADAARAWRVSSLVLLDDWSRHVLQADGALIEQAEMKPLYDKVSRAEARAITLTPPPSALRRLPDGRILIRVAPDPTVRDLRLRIASSAPIRRASVNGILAPGLLEDARKPTTISWVAPGQGLTVLLEPAVHGQLNVRFSALRDGWPADADPLPPRPANVMPWYNSDTRVAMWSLEVK